MLGHLLRHTGNEVRTAHDGNAALRTAAEFHPHVVLLDIGLPDVGGYQVAMRLRKLSGGDAIALLAITGWGQEADRERSAAAGFDRHLVKPVEFGALLGVIADLRAERTSDPN